MWRDKVATSWFVDMRPHIAFCDERYFKCRLFDHLKQRALARVVTNEKEVLAAMRKFVDETAVTGKTLHLIEADYNVLPFEE